MNDNNQPPSFPRSEWGAIQQTTMTPREFFRKVAQMRQFQRESDGYRNYKAMSEAKRLESEINREIERVTAILEERKPQQQTTFKNN